MGRSKDLKIGENFQSCQMNESNDETEDLKTTDNKIVIKQTVK